MIYFIIILLTIYFSSRADLLYENITGVLITPQYRIYTMIYIIILAWFFGYKTYKIFQKQQLPSIYYFTIFISSLTMTIGAISPYHLNNNDFFSHLHVYCSMISSISFLIHLFIYFSYLKKSHLMKYNQIFPYYLKGIEFLILLTIVFGRMNGYIEILYTIIVCWCLYKIEK